MRAHSDAWSMMWQLNRFLYWSLIRLWSLNISTLTCGSGSSWSSWSADGGLLKIESYAQGLEHLKCLTSWLSFSIFNRPKKKFKLHTVYPVVSECTTRWSGGRAHLWVKVQLIRQLLLKAFPEGNQGFWVYIQWPSSWGSVEGIALPGQTGKHTYRILPSQLQLLLAATSSLQRSAATLVMLTTCWA